MVFVCLFLIVVGLHTFQSKHEVRLRALGILFVLFEDRTLALVASDAVRYL